ncbi:hypothetical protein SELMODRAFT_170246 [Selaginella moellendorffii]|uniref:protein-S-isoprenylcysteine alpha-carbonyl methylesterase n=2 Tax=Selaginella moellendorffii TaxID=88036 RepID=D8RCH8_SELML|nr:probable isoprenylcysteine alpha-carbonyl methylesterase ICMEL2 isoform X2 [Selaginella moellendorffii]XP_024520239.1 probable isoprenylcysteine alpha-carbonyl methylesterase ICMEL2 isoform X2 [Selaginella moellendorffii]XP_024529361.1 probable isoprenylcysteine alpha-carbonyl methylesterase ICMEL2 isoform X2 [Selaginella moellendorffii]XP_024529362.1 probable isoprenylcysteine alpha-carbonyl methylesterase ICMEL2 isoform X2 [Selaginella moellendorffii]EFJ08258.1 hypothetical protein SELMODR|eukprot:XP_024520238.1 probable isoprenylcysteine alpha-carbonyl methylesterase ICMEL2 isoform X2 [Selaginella moellendorffii]
MTVVRSKSFGGFACKETKVEIPDQQQDDELSRLISPSESFSFGHQQQRRRRSPSSEFSGQIQSQHSFREDVSHAASETYLLTRLTFKLLRYLGIGYRWMVKFIALSLYATFLMPGFIQVSWYYYFSKRVHRSIVYGDQPRNRLDLYLPEKTDGSKPAVAFVTGGAWIIGYKAWGALLGRQLVDRGVIVACIDYRNFPQGGISDMVADVSTALSFFCNNISSYGGNVDRLYLAGQSAGAHIASCALVNQARKEAIHGKCNLLWSATQFKAFFGISGGYNLFKLVDHFHNRGLYRSLFLSVMEGEGSLAQHSPEIVVSSREFQPAVPLLPTMVLCHGTADYSIPHSSSVSFAEALGRVNANVVTNFYKDKTHTDIIIQDPMRGGKDELLYDILEVIYRDNEAEVDRGRLDRRMLPEILLKLARKVSPF